MCGRFILTASGEEVAEAFGLPDVPALSPRYNIAPTQEVAVVRRLGPEQPRTLALLKWGFLPAEGRRMLLINARSESADERPAFHDSFAQRRCLIPADGFYEWKGEKGPRQPFHIRLRDGHVFAFAGLWEPMPTGPGACTILTTEPNTLLREIHDRMPVILPREHYDLWLDPRVRGPGELFALMGPYAAEAMAARPVSTRVNDPKNDDAECLRPL